MKIGEIFFFYILYSITNTIFFVWYVNLYPSLIWEWLHLVMIYFFMAGMAYFLSYLLRSISIAMIPTLCYSFLSIAGSGSKAPVWSFYEPEGMSAFMFGTKYVWFILVGVLFFALGWILNKCYTSYWIFTESWGMWALYKGNLAKNKEKLLVFSLLSYIIEERKGCWIWHRQ